MSEQISVGDLVVIVRASHCCGRDKTLGRIFTVEAISSTNYQCRRCKVITEASLCAWRDGWVVPLSRLKRIPPLAELEQTTEQEKEPA